MVDLGAVNLAADHVWTKRQAFQTTRLQSYHVRLAHQLTNLGPQRHGLLLGQTHKTRLELFTQQTLFDVALGSHQPRGVALVVFCVDGESEAGKGHPQLLPGEFVEFVLKLVSQVVVIQGELHFCVFSLEDEVDEDVPSALVYPVLDPEDVLLVLPTQPIKGVLEIPYVSVEHFAAHPVVELYLHLFGVLVQQFVEVDEDRGPVVVVEVGVDLPGAQFLRDRLLHDLGHDSEVGLDPRELAPGLELEAALLFQDDLHFLVEGVGVGLRPQAELLNPVRNPLFSHWV